ncbi:dual specificity tyrosine-phosphorylation-regulated kinase 4-like isoform X2 [Salvia splendens]|uniref:dual specificity tyrosine-phosphorylation-regulated kinase 4-like isoform X2 n=1 Tax=Salvia splendens TaxID=180675 RepID=UPI001C27D0B9|nr:dual specificity tyrosine-phosphorylation-regulated kinase 4-like isoform X2 [Salvia splendens]
MAEVELEAVLRFLRENGLSESASALMEDVTEKSRAGASELEKFVFPMAPPPPMLRIRRPEESSGGSSDDEFVSLGSSTTELCSSEFTNPYGVRTSRAASQTSSDGLTQFGTARDYPDFDMQNDLFWYKEKDEDFAMPTPHAGADFCGDLTEDKFVTAVQTGEHAEDQAAYNFISVESIGNVASRCTKDSLKDETYKDYYELGDHVRLEQGIREQTDPHDNQLMMNWTNSNFSVKQNSTYDWVDSFDNDHDLNLHTVQKNNQPNDNDFDFTYDRVITGELHEPQVPVNEENNTVADDELHLCETKDEEFETFNLRIIHRKNRTGFEENKEFPIVINSIIASRYYVAEFLGSAAFSKVVQAHDLYSGMDVCLKIIKNDKDFFDQSLDEIKLLKFVNKHDPADEWHILRLYDYFYHQEHLFIVTELLKANLYEFQKYNLEFSGDAYFTLSRLQIITQQCLEALSYLHDLGIIHCDLKPENILIKSYRRCEIKVIDLGSSCFQSDNLSLYVQSRSYRAPEVMLGLPYDQKIDLWSVGCILAELHSGEVLFPNEGVVTLLARIIGILGPIDVEMLQNGQETNKYFTDDHELYSLNEETNELELIVPEESSLEHHLQISDSIFADFLKYLLEINPVRRPTAREALQHPWLSISYT